MLSLQVFQALNNRNRPISRHCTGLCHLNLLLNRPQKLPRDIFAVSQPSFQSPLHADHAARHLLCGAAECNDVSDDMDPLHRIEPAAVARRCSCSYTEHSQLACLAGWPRSAETHKSERGRRGNRNRPEGREREREERGR